MAYTLNDAALTAVTGDFAGNDYFGLDGATNGPRKVLCSRFVLNDKSYADPAWITSLAASKVGLGSVENKSSATIRSEITSANVTTALGYTPYNATNPSGYITSSALSSYLTTATAASTYQTALVSGTSIKTINGTSVLGSGDITISASSVTYSAVITALGFTPYNSTNPNGYISSITSANVTTALGYTPYNATNPNGYISSITSANVTTALGYTPYNSSNPSGYITSSALSSYLPLSGGTLTGNLTIPRHIGVNSLVLNTYTTVNPSSNVFLYSQPNDRDSWIYLDSADTGSNWGIYHRQIDSAVSGLPGNSIGFVGGGNSALKAYISLADGSANFAGALTQAGNQVLHAGNYTSYSPSLTGSGASGTWGINVTGTAGSISGYNNPATGATANTIVYRDGSGHITGNYLFGNYINTGDDVSSGTLTYLMGKFGDNYHRSATAAKVAAFLSGQTMNINGSSTSCSGNAASASSVAWGNVSSKPGSIFYYAGWATDANTVASNSSSFCYSVNAAATGPLAYFEAGGYGLQLSCGYGSGDNFYWRTRNGDNGTWQTWRRFLTEDVWINNKHFGSDGNIYSNASMRAAIFYDQNDTGYFVNPNGTSELSALTAATRTRWDMPRQTFNRQAYTGATNYWTGTRGWGNTINWNQAWGYGFGGFDIWGENTQHPQGNGYIHAQGICSGLHHVADDGSSAYGFQLVGGNSASDRLWYRGAWGNTGNTWREIPMLGVNSGNGEWMWFAGWYDNNNSGYYVDPNGTSRMNAVVADNLYAYGTVTAYYSDDRLKTRFSNIANALDKVCSLNGFFYVGNSVAESLGYKKKMEVGLSAQEVQRILPEVVVPAPVDENYLTIQYDRVVPLLVEAIKELRLELNQLKSLVKL